MKNTSIGLSLLDVALIAVAAVATAEDAKDEAIKQDRKLIEGTWQVVALDVNGNRVSDEDAKKITVVNGPDGTWTLFSDGKEVGKGTNSLNSGRQTRLSFAASIRSISSNIARSS